MNGSSDPRRKQAIWQLILGVLGMVIALGGLIWNMRWITSAVAGPVPMTVAQLAKVNDPKSLSNPWITLTYDEMVDTGFGIVTEEGGKQTDSTSYVLIKVENSWLIAEVPLNQSGRQVTGYLGVWSSPLQKEGIEKIKGSQAAERTNYLPYQLDAVYEYRLQCFCMVGLLVALFIGGVALAVAGLLKLRTVTEDD